MSVPARFDSRCITRRTAWRLALAASGLTAVLGAHAAIPLALAPTQELPGNYEGWKHGEALAMEGDVLVLGVPSADQSNNGTQYQNNGLVIVYRWRNGRWISDAVIGWSSMGLIPQNNARLGAAVAVSGDLILIGCPGCSGTRPKAYLVEMPEPMQAVHWYPVQPDLDSPADPENGIGASVAIADDIIAVGAPRATFGNPEFGAVAVGRFNGTSVVWDDPVFGWENSRFGHAVALASTSLSLPPSPRFSLLVGAPQYVASGGFGLAGRAALYEKYIGGTWTLEQQFANPNPGLGDGLGTAVAIYQPHVDDTAYIALGAPGRVLAGSPAAGTARVYSLSPGDADFVLDTEVQHGTPAFADRFGTALALHGGRLLVGADGRAVDLANDAGSAYVYQRSFNAPTFSYEWKPKQTLIPRGGGDGTFGHSVALGPRAGAISAPLHDGSNGNSIDIGSIQTYLCDGIFATDMGTTADYQCAGP